jgi:uncharacterized protein YjiS (DUF1127 family)
LIHRNDASRPLDHAEPVYHFRERAMATQIKTYPIVESAINLFGNWLKHRQEMRELRDMNSGDFARIAQDLCVTPAELDSVIRKGAARQR